MGPAWHRRRGRSLVTRAALAVVAVISATVAASTAPAGAGASAQQASGTLGLSLSATTGLVDGQSVDYTVSGLPADFNTAIQVRLCDEPVAPGVGELILADECLALAWVSTWGDPIRTGSATVLEAYDVRPRDGSYRVDWCRDEPFDCSVVAFVVPPPEPESPDGAPVVDLVSVPVDFDPAPLLVLGAGLGQPADVFVSGPPGATVALAHCVQHPDVGSGLDDCTREPDVVVSPTGSQHLEITAPTSVAIDGVTFDCRFRSCRLATFDPTTGVRLAVRDLPGSLPSASFTLDRSTDLTSITWLEMTVTSQRGVGLVGQCVASVLDGSVGVTQGCQQIGSVGEPGTSVLRPIVRSVFVPASGGPALACADDPRGCLVAIGDASGGTAWYVPITFAPPPTMTATPATGLVEGDPISVTVTGLVAGDDYSLRRCLSYDRCDDSGVPVHAGADGTASATITASPRLSIGGIPQYCRSACQLGLVPSSIGETITTGYEMAAGRVTADPSVDLADGETVSLSGTGLMSSYDGRRVWIVETGEWTVDQCDAAVSDDPTLLGVFTHCGTDVRAVDVPGSSLALDVTVRAELPRILGGVTDCTASEGACALVLSRMEQDGSVSLHTVPLSFGS
jgi:Neocarzinostatin family